MERVGYNLATYSSMFNGEALPEKDQLIDLVGYLNGDPREWSERLARAIAAEEKLIRSVDAQNEFSAELEALRAEVEKYRVIANDPESIFAEAIRLEEDTQKRLHFSRDMEAHLHALLSSIGSYLSEAQQSVPLAQEEARAIVKQARATAQEIEYAARSEAQSQLEAAEKRATEVTTQAEAEASRIIDKAGVESRRIRADAGRIVDQLLLEGDQYLEAARVDRLQGELEKQRGESLVERMKLRAKIDLAQVIMQAQRTLADTGATGQSDLLDILLQDLGINEIPSNSPGVGGRHRKVIVRPSNGDTSPETDFEMYSFDGEFASVGEEVDSHPPLPRRRPAQ